VSREILIPVLFRVRSDKALRTALRAANGADLGMWYATAVVVKVTQAVLLLVVLGVFASGC
jgi:hypothetical protein